MVDAIPPTVAIDLFCGVGGLSFGLQKAGVRVAAGVDIDETCGYPFESNIDAPFLAKDLRDVTSGHLNRLWPEGSVRLLAGRAPCQPFSSHRRGADTSDEDEWSLLTEFGRLVRSTRPEIVTMENVPRIVSSAVFREFVDLLESLKYSADWRSCFGPDFGLAQNRRRLVLLASRLGPIAVPTGPSKGKRQPTVRDKIGRLPGLSAGGVDPRDPMHASRNLTEINLERIRASTPGGTWEDWPEELRSPCHRKASGASFRNVYARMEWDKPAPTITTLAHNFGTGRFGHPEQDRPISLREAAILQGFPRNYRFLKEGQKVFFSHQGRLIGNAVPPPIARSVGTAVLRHVTRHSESVRQEALS
jgi:DNA (cytosine-5)-methyltransferase 1